MPMMSLTRRSGKNCDSCWTGCRVAGAGAEALRWASRGHSTHPTSCPRGCRAEVAKAEALWSASRGRSTHPTRGGRSTQPMDTTWMGRRRRWCGARVIRGRMGMAGRRSSIISGFFRCARTCAGATRCTSRSCRPYGGQTYRCDVTSPSSWTGAVSSDSGLLEWDSEPATHLVLVTNPLLTELPR